MEFIEKIRDYDWRGLVSNILGYDWAGWMASASQYAENNKTIIAAVVVPLLTVLVTAIIQRGNSKLTAALKIGEMRQAWINDLRSNMSEFYSRTFYEMDEDEFEKHALEIVKIRAEVVLRMNKTDEDYNEMLDVMKDMLANLNSGRGDEYDKKKGDFLDVSQRILKREWDRLKKDVKKRRV